MPSNGSPATTSSWARAASARSSSSRRRCSWSGAGATRDLRVPTTLRRAARCWSRAGHAGARAPRPSSPVAYRFLRQVEHRLQMVADRQTHSLPEKPADLARFAVFLGYADAAAFADGAAAPICAGCGATTARCSSRCPICRTVPAAPGELDFRGHADPPVADRGGAARTGLRGGRGGSFAAVRSWQSGRLRALRSDRARELLAAGAAGACSPRLPGSRSRTRPSPASTRFLARLPAGVQLLSLFQRNPGAARPRRRGAGRRALSLADILAGHPAALDGLLSPGTTMPTRRRCCAPACAMRGRWRTPSRSSAARCGRRISPSRVATMEGRHRRRRGRAARAPPWPMPR